MTNATNEDDEKTSSGGHQPSQLANASHRRNLDSAGHVHVFSMDVVLRRLYHGTPAVEALGYTATPGVYVLYLQMAYLRNQPLATQALIVVGVILGAGVRLSRARALAW